MQISRVRSIHIIAGIIACFAELYNYIGAKIDTNSNDCDPKVWYLV